MVLNHEADFTHPFAFSHFTWFPRKNYNNPADTEHRNTRRKKQSESEIT